MALNRVTFTTTLVLAFAAAALSARVRAQKSDATDLLAKAASYLTSYEKAFSVVVAEEKYSQVLMSEVRVTTPFGARDTRPETVRKARTLRSDVLQTSIGQNDWVAFRDVYEVDGQPVRDRDTRLQRLFIDAPAQALTQARRIVSESARYNLGTLQRNINVPTMALTYLRGSNQSRSKFTVAGRQDVDGVPAIILDFAEQSRPTVIRSASADLPAKGRFWIDPQSGRVLKSEISVDGKISKSKITVTYGTVPKLAVWAPITMKEEYTGRETIIAEATYSNFRQFTVAVAESIK